MDCDHVQDVLPLYAQGRLSLKKRDEVSDHLATCEACRQELARVQEEDRLLRGYLSAAPILDRRAGTVERMLREHTLRRPNGRMGRFLALRIGLDSPHRQAILVNLLIIVLVVLGMFSAGSAIAHTMFRLVSPHPRDIIVPPPSPTILPWPTALWMDVEAIEAVAGFQLLQPHYLPPECVLQERYYDPTDKIARQYYSCTLVIEQQKASEINLLVGTDSSEQIIVGREPALYVSGGWIVDEATGAQVWRPGPQQLWFTRGGVLVFLIVPRPGALTKEEFLRIAESVR